MRRYEKVFSSIWHKDYDHQLIEKLHKLNFEVVGNFIMNNGKVIVIEKFLLSLGCRLVTTIVINIQHNLSTVCVVTAGGKISEFLDLGASKNTHHKVIMIVEEIFKEEVL